MNPYCCDSGTRVCTECAWIDFNVELKNFIRKRVSNEHDCEDILQDVFIKIHKSIGSIREEHKFRVWIYKIARNIIIDYYRRNKNPDYELTEDIESNEDEELSANAEVAACLKALINRMPEIYKQALLLTEFHNMSQRELGEKLGLSFSGAKSRVQRAKIMLKKMILSCCELEMDRHGNVIEYQFKSKC